MLTVTVTVLFEENAYLMYLPLWLSNGIFIVCILEKIEHVIQRSFCAYTQPMRDDVTL